MIARDRVLPEDEQAITVEEIHWKQNEQTNEISFYLQIFLDLLDLQIIFINHKTISTFATIQVLKMTVIMSRGVGRKNCFLVKQCWHDWNYVKWTFSKSVEELSCRAIKENVARGNFIYPTFLLTLHLIHL